MFEPYALLKTWDARDRLYARRVHHLVAAPLTELEVTTIRKYRTSEALEISDPKAAQAAFDVVAKWEPPMVIRR